MGARIVIICPERWSIVPVDILAERLTTSDLPHCVGVEIHSDDKLKVLRKVSEDDD